MLKIGFTVTVDRLGKAIGTDMRSRPGLTCISKVQLCFFLCGLSCSSWGRFWEIGSSSQNLSQSLSLTSFLIVHGNNTATTTIYDPRTGIAVAGPVLAGAASDGALSIAIKSGIHMGKVLILHGGNTSATSLFDPQTRTISAGPGVGTNIALGSLAFEVYAGPASGKVKVAVGFSTTAFREYNPATNAFTAGGTSTCGPGTGSHWFERTGFPGFLVIVCAGPGTAWSVYNPTTDTFTAGTALGTQAGNGAFSFTVNGGVQAGKAILMHGDSGGVYDRRSVYDPVGNSFGGFLTGSPSIVTGGNSFPITTGLQAGNILLVRAGATAQTSVDLTGSDTFIAGPALVAVADAGAHSFTLGSDSQAGRTIVVHGNGTAGSSIYNPVDNTFSMGPTLSGSVAGGAHTIAFTHNP
jgi:hypothetical protein